MSNTKYFVSYTWSILILNKIGTGNTGIILEEPIYDILQIRALEETIKNLLYSELPAYEKEGSKISDVQVAVTNFVKIGD